jgi:hypothetical protein
MKEGDKECQCSGWKRMVEIKGNDGSDGEGKAKDILDIYKEQKL